MEELLKHIKETVTNPSAMQLFDSYYISKSFSQGLGALPVAKCIVGSTKRLVVLNMAAELPCSTLKFLFDHNNLCLRKCVDCSIWIYIAISTISFYFGS